MTAPAMPITTPAARRRAPLGVGRTPLPLGGAYAGMLVLLYLPVALLFLFSFSSGRTLAFPIESLTLDWYAAVLDDADAIGVSDGGEGPVIFVSK